MGSVLANSPLGGLVKTFVGLILGSFVLASALAGLLGAANLGTALAFGQIALAAMTVYVMLKR